MIVFSEEKIQAEEVKSCWTILIVDDEPTVHQVTRFALKDTEVLGRKLNMIHASSTRQAKELLRENPDIALVLLDVVMESHDAGLKLVHHIRESMNNTSVRIVLRTGQPGYAPEREVMVNYDINDYKEKAELTASRLFTTIVAGIRTYQDIVTLKRTQAGLTSVVSSSTTLFSQHTTEDLASEVLRTLSTAPFSEAAAFIDAPDIPTSFADGTKKLASLFTLTPQAQAQLQLQVQPQALVSDGKDHFIRLHKSVPGLIGLRTSRELEPDERQILELYLNNAAIAFHNIQLGRDASMLARLPTELPEPVLRVSTQGEVLFANPAGMGLLTHWQTTVGSNVPPEWQIRLRDMVKMNRRFDTRLSFDDREFEFTMSPVAELNYINIFGRDVTDMHDAVNQLRHAAFHDDLTDLHNRTHFRAELETAIAAATESNSSIGLLLMDLDHFKQINDTLGHAAGDDVLRITGKRLIKIVRNGDIVARLGGDEFAVLVREVDDPNELIILANRLQESVALPMHIGQNHWNIGASIGVTSFPNDARTASDLLGCADLAMYHSKRDGSGVKPYDGAVHRSVRKRTSIELVLRDALKNQSLDLHFQPVVDLNTSKIYGAEALARLSHPNGTPISPTEFIPIAEECGLIEELGEWVLHTALAKAHQWHTQGHPDLHIAFNMSARQLQMPDIVKRFDSLMNNTHIDRTRVEIELTESVLIGNAKEAVAKIWELRSLGVDLSVDDFGTGYSSLSYLRNMPVSKLKIDRSFVMDLHDNQNALSIVDAVLSLSNSLHLTVVAEGVETLEQAKILRDIGCTLCQGYLYSRPVTADAFSRLLELDHLSTETPLAPVIK
ncbi:MAG: two-component system response regulator [Pseudomonadales bacterium]